MILKIDAFPDSPLLYNSLSILVQVPSLFVILAIWATEICDVRYIMYLWYLEVLELPIWNINFKPEDQILISLVMREMEILQFTSPNSVHNGPLKTGSVQKISKSLVKSLPDQ